MHYIAKRHLTILILPFCGFILKLQEYEGNVWRRMFTYRHTVTRAMGGITKKLNEKLLFATTCNIKWSKWSVAEIHDFLGPVQELCSFPYEQHVYSWRYKCYFKITEVLTAAFFLYTTQCFKPNLTTFSGNWTKYNRNSKEQL